MPKLRKKTVARKTNYVPYVRGFHPPTRSEAVEASIFTENHLPYTEKALKEALERREKEDLGVIEELKPHSSFKPIPKCTSIDDWLAQYCETGQSFSCFIETCPWLSKRKCKGIRQKFVSTGTTLQNRYPEGSIYLLPIGDFNNDSSPEFIDLVQYSQIFFGIPVKTLPETKLIIKNNGDIFCRPHGSSREYLIKSRTKGNRYQLNIYTLLDFVREVAPDDALATIALTMSDIYEAKPDLFVAGMAAGLARVAVFSFYRYNPKLEFSPEFWYEVKEKKTGLSEAEIRKLFLQRSCRLLVHEIGHLLGVDHCIFYECCMNGSGHLQEDFRQPMFLCPVDLHKLSYMCGFDILQRYGDLRHFFDKFGLINEVNWIDKRLRDIENSKMKSMKPMRSLKLLMTRKNGQYTIEDNKIAQHSTSIETSIHNKKGCDNSNKPTE